MFKPSAQDEKTYIDDLRTVEKGEETRIRVGALPQVYQSLGIPAGLVRTNKDVIIKDSITKHSVPLDVVENLPKLYADPIMVMDSRTVDGRIVALVDAKDKEGQQILVVISPNKRQKGGYHFIPSFYGKEELSDFVAKNIEEGNLKYIKSSQALDSLQLRPQVKTLLSSSITNVLQKDAIVKQNATESYYQVAAENEKYNIIPSVYGKNDLDNLIKSSRVRYRDTERANLVIRPSSLQLLGVDNSVGSLTRSGIIQSSDNVNTFWQSAVVRDLFDTQGDLFEQPQSKQTQTAQQSQQAKQLPAEAQKQVDDLFAYAEKQEGVKKEAPLFSDKKEIQKIEKSYTAVVYSMSLENCSSVNTDIPSSAAF